MENQIRNLILCGNTLSTVYSTITPQPTKKQISEIFCKINYSSLAEHGWNYLRISIEKALFSLHRRYQYSRNVMVENDICLDYMIYEEGIPKLALIILGQEFLFCDDLPVFGMKEYEINSASLEKKADYCNSKGLPLLKLPIIELIDWPFLADEFRKALKDFKYAEEHNEWAVEKYFDLSNLWMCNFDNYHQIRASKICGCLSCGSVIEPTDAILCGQDNSMACPLCHETSLISDFQGFKITPESMTIIKENYKEPEE